MRRFLFAFVLLPWSPALAWLAAPAQAQPPEWPGDELANTSTNLMAQQYRIVQYRIVSGRLSGEALTASNWNRTLVNQSPARGERLTLEVNGGAATIHYELRSPAEDLKIDLLAGKHFSLHRQGKKLGVATFDFEQPPSGDLSLTVGVEPNRRVVAAPNLWRLAIAEGEMCRETLFPLLETIRPNWHLAATTTAIEEALFRFASGSHAADRKQWKAWVDELGGDTFSRRMVAQRKLLAAGPAVTPFLEGLDPAALDAEQRERVRVVMSQFEHGGEDSVDQIAASLAPDAEIWLSLFSRSDESRRALAARQLARIFGRPIELDPAADAATRARQITRLRARLQAGSAKAGE